MKELLFKPTFISKLEFWALTTILVFSAFFMMTGGASTYQFYFDELEIPFSYYGNFVFPGLIKNAILYAAILLLNFKLIPMLLEKRRIVLAIFLVLLVFVAMGLVFGIADTYLKTHLLFKYRDLEDAYFALFQKSFFQSFWIILMVGTYTLVKNASLYLLSNSEAIQTKYKIVTRDALAAVVFWMVSIFMLILIDADGELVVGWGIVGPCSILLYCLSFNSLIPKAYTAKRPFLSYALKVAFVLVLAFIPVILVGLVLTQDEDTCLVFSLFNSAFQMFFTAPLCWVLYKRQLQGKEEVTVLQKELGQSNANLDFLRSQINPHFLFNTLNTLYGTALQENSERTAQGIQMLGDMMRFMLHENHQHKILLSREIDYMRNYIELQALRTSSSPSIEITTQLEEVYSDKFIAPMLLIPFVENAFKHGISLKEKSWIRISLHCDQNKLFFDVYNSTHTKQGVDPEYEKSGVGLENVKQRLALLYPNKYELAIRETPGEFFVHFTLSL